MALTKVSTAMLDDFVINVKDLGAAGDGVTDDRVAIQAAIRAAGDSGVKKIYFPAGTYLCELTSGISITDSTGSVIDGFVATGAGKNATILKLGLTSGKNYQSFFNCSSIDGLEIADMTFDFNELRPASRTSTSERFHNPAIIVQGANSKDVYIHDCSFINMSVDQPVRLASFKSDTTLVDADFIDGVRLENLDFIKAADAVPNNTFQEDISAIYIYGKNVHITNCRFDTEINLTTLSSTGRGRTAIEAYGYNYNISNCQFRRWRRAHIIGTYPNDQTDDYFTRNWNISSNNYRQTESLIDVAFRVHIYGPIKFSNNIVTYGETQTGGVPSFHAFSVAGGSVPTGEYNDAFVISDNFFDYNGYGPGTVGSSYSMMMVFQNAPRVVFSGNTVLNNVNGIIYGEARTGDDANFATGYVIKNNYFYNIATNASLYGRNDNRPIWIESAATFGDMIITDNVWENIGVKGSRTSSGYNGNIFAGLFSMTGTNLVVANNVIKGDNSAFNASTTYTGTWSNRVDQNNINVDETD